MILTPNDLRDKRRNALSELIDELHCRLKPQIKQGQGELRSLDAGVIVRS